MIIVQGNNFKKFNLYTCFSSEVRTSLWFANLFINIIFAILEIPTVVWGNESKKLNKRNEQDFKEDLVIIYCSFLN